MSGTLLVVRALDRRGIPRATSMAAIVVDIVSYYAAYVAALAIALAVVWLHESLTLFDHPAGGPLRAFGGGRSCGPRAGEPGAKAAAIDPAAAGCRVGTSSACRGDAEHCP
jgi:hypothetical protein